jgi:hypothetical protein
MTPEEEAEFLRRRKARNLVVAGTLLYRSLDRVNAFPPQKGTEDRRGTLGVP